MCHMRAVHYGARSAGRMKAKPKKYQQKEHVQVGHEANPCDCYTFSTIQAPKAKKNTWTRGGPSCNGSGHPRDLPSNPCGARRPQLQQAAMDSLGTVASESRTPLLKL